MKHRNFIFPQWQGNTEKSPLYGAREFERLYLSGEPICMAPVSEFDDLPLERGISGRADIVRQLKAAFGLPEQNQPETMFSVGGGCDAGLVPAAYLNQKYQGDLCLVWFDAHGDLNTPQTSPSGMFCGMPLRTLLGEGDPEIVDMLPRVFEPHQVVMAGLRITDRVEADFIEEKQIAVVGVEQLNRGLSALLDAVQNTGCRNLCIHIDLDVLDPGEFPNTPFPHPGGIRPEVLMSQVRALNDKFAIKGLGIYEYAVSGGEKLSWLEELVEIGTRLSEGKS